MSDSAAMFETPEFKQAVADAAAREVAKLLEASKSPTTGQPIDPTMRAVFDGIATSLAELTGQGSGRVYVSPEVLKQREHARDKMVDLILAARAAKKIPAYRVTGKVLLDDQLVDPFWIGADHISRPTEIDWPGIPNDAMVPLNETAKEIWAAWKDSVGSIVKVVPEDRLGVTAKGLVVRNGAVSATMARRTPGPAAEEPVVTDGFRVHHKENPGQLVGRHVLGTIAPPVRQMGAHRGQDRI